MKKYTTITLSMLLMALAQGCSNDVADLPSSALRTIEFSQPYAGKQSRALGEINNDNLANSQFKVWSWKDDGTCVFDGQVITYDDQEGWTYSPKVLWDIEHAYDFVAVAPSDNIGDELTVNQSGISLKNVPLMQNAEEGIDYLISDPIAGIGYRDAADGLQFTFRHVLGKLQVWAKYTPEEAISGQIKAVELSQFKISCEGYTHYDFSLPYGSSAKADYDNKCWTPSSYNLGFSELESADNVNLSASEYQLVVPAQFVAPTPAGCELVSTLSFSYNVVISDNEADNLTADFPATEMKALSAFHQGYVTNLYLNIRVTNSSLGLISADVEQKVEEFDTFNNSVDQQGNPNF